MIQAELLPNRLLAHAPKQPAKRPGRQRTAAAPSLRSVYGLGIRCRLCSLGLKWHRAEKKHEDNDNSHVYMLLQSASHTATYIQRAQRYLGSGSRASPAATYSWRWGLGCSQHTSHLVSKHRDWKCDCQ